MASPAPTTGYAPVNGLQMYYEIHGDNAAGGVPLLVLHGAYQTFRSMGPIVPGLAATRQVIGVELHGHGHTADVDRPITYEGMADDVAALIGHLGLGPIDVFGYSMGGGVATQLAIRHPKLVRKLVLASASFRYDGMHQVLIDFLPNVSPELFAGSPIEAEYLEVAPKPEDFPTLVAKLRELDLTPFDWTEGVRAIAAPTLYVVGDSDAIRLEHAVELFKLLGGGIMGDMSGPPKSQFAVLPSTTHFMPPGYGLLDRHELLLAMIVPFLDAPMPESD